LFETIIKKYDKIKEGRGMVKKFFCLVIITALLSSALVLPTSAENTVFSDGESAETVFSDVSSEDWFFDAVKAVKEANLMNGISDSEFAPEEAITRGMFVTTLYRMAGEPETIEKHTFIDIDTGIYYETPVCWASENKIVTGISETDFLPEELITREQIATIIHRYAMYKGIDVEKRSELSFSDASEVSVWAIDGVSYCITEGILKGDGEGRLNPDKTATRAELAQILVNTLNIKESISATAQKVKNGAKAAVVFMHDDGGKATGRWLVRVLPKYNLYGTVSIIGKSIDPEYNVNEPDNFKKWRVILDDSDGRLNFSVHSHGHRYLGETDEEESGILSDGQEYSYEKGHMTKDIADERARINSIYPDERLLTFVKPGTKWPEGKKQVSDAAMNMIKEHYIAMRNTGGGVDTLPPEDIYSVKSIMARASDDYTDAENNQTSDFWIEQMNSAIEQNGLIVYLFHDINDEKAARGNTTAQSRVEMLFEAMSEKVESGEIWNGQFDEVMQYTQEYNAITLLQAENFPFAEKITVRLEDSISKIDTDLTTGKFANRDMFDYPVTVKTELPYDWEYVKLTQSYNNRTEILKPFTEDGKKYVYANVVPDQEAAVLSKADAKEYVSMITIDGKDMESFDPAKYYYKIILPANAIQAPQIAVMHPEATVEQAQLSENGEGSAYVYLHDLRYEIYFCKEKTGREALLKINPSRDDKELTATKKAVKYLDSIGKKAYITDKGAYEMLRGEYDNVSLFEEKLTDNCTFEFDDDLTEEQGDFKVCYNDFVLSLKECQEEKLVMTYHPEEKGDLHFSVFKDQIKFLQMNGFELNIITK